MGCEISNCTVSIDELHEKLNPLKAFPVPFTSELNVSIQKEFEGGEIKVFDSTGRLVFEKNLTSSEVKLNTAQWWEGIYLVQLVNESEVYTVKVIRAGN